MKRNVSIFIQGKGIKIKKEVTLELIDGLNEKETGKEMILSITNVYTDRNGFINDLFKYNNPKILVNKQQFKSNIFTKRFKLNKLFDRLEEQLNLGLAPIRFE